MIAIPYKIEKRGEKYAVLKKGSEKVVGTHKTREKAEAQVRALYSKEDRKRA